MRIGVDMLGTQSPGSRGRGIGRFSDCLLAALIEAAPRHEFVLYAHDGLPADGLPDAANTEVRTLPAAATAGAQLQALVDTGADGLDWLLVLSPFELHAEYDPPARPLSGPRLAALVHDLIGFRFQERYLTYEPVARRLYRNLERLGQYDLILTNSRATRDDCRSLLGLPPGRLVALHGAADLATFHPEPPGSDPGEAAGVLARLGVEPPYVFTLASDDERKNLAGLVEAFALLPGALRERHHLVVACALTGPSADRVRALARRHGIEPRLMLTGPVSDQDLRVLYQRCAGFAFPSLFEGFGLPIIEAMACGAPVLAGRNSAQVEVAGDAALLVNAQDPHEIAHHLARLLGDPSLAAALARRGQARAGELRWEDAAGHALRALEAGPAVPTRRRVRPRVAMLTPLPPQETGIADYAARLLGPLGDHLDLDLFHDPGVEPAPGAATAFPAHDIRLLPRLEHTLGHRALIAQMGNSHYHGRIHDSFLERGGILVLHDLYLTGFHWWRAHCDPPWCTSDTIGYFRDAIRACEPHRAAELEPLLAELLASEEGLERGLTRRGVALNQRLVARADAVIIHSAWAAQQLAAWSPEHAHKLVVIPHGAAARQVSVEARARTRDRLDLPREALLIASFGNVHPQKMNVEALESFARIVPECPGALFVLAGPEMDFGAARDEAARLRIADRVRFLGRLDDPTFEALIAATDLGVALRRPPTNGETSGGLLHLLRHGVPTLVIDTDAFADYPDTVVRKVTWDDHGPERLASALRALASSAGDRQALGQAAIEHVRRHHAWSRVAELYAAVVDRVAATRTRQAG